MVSVKSVVKAQSEEFGLVSECKGGLSPYKSQPGCTAHSVALWLYSCFASSWPKVVYTVRWLRGVLLLERVLNG